MSLQLIVDAPSGEAVFEALGPVAEWAEIFPVPSTGFGICIPSKVLDDVPEAEVRGALSRFPTYDLYEGKWIDA